MNYLLEIVIFNVIIYTICGINIAKKGKLKKKATIGKLGLFIGYTFLQTVLAYYIGGARTFSEGWSAANWNLMKGNGNEKTIF